ncbi:sensor histidine kinase [Alienimonas californiensis]|uniref:histidine kinase n=1 Tax=Alienimonas californiensis TaxID=2527989 RepID=A0A517PBH0_9PLAN|nr:ATP-binding protein [Alienimonas californiensis]QDT16702.1 Phytochrome-like protein cph1 [Alienimonas californiensis]
MPSSHLMRVLVVEDSDDHYELLRKRIGADGRSGVELHRRSSLTEGLACLDSQAIDAVLLDLGLPDSAVTDTLGRFKRARPELPVVVLTSLDDLDFAAEAVSHGAQDFLVKSQLSQDRVVRSLRYAIERKQKSLGLEKTNQELRNFAHTVAHEVRHPAAAALLALGCVRMEPLSEQGEEMVGLAEESLRTLSDLVRELLNFAEIENASAPPKPIEMDRVLDHVLARFEKELTAVGGTVERVPLPTVTSHWAQLSLLFQNLIANAIKYRSPERDLRIRIAPAEADLPGVVVSDNGIGVAEKHLPKLFDVFYRADPAEDVPGTGVGLALCRRIVQRYGGSMTVRSTAGEGSTFEATFGEPSPAAEPPPHPPHHPGPDAVRRDEDDARATGRPDEFDAG